jgi:Na+-translocating ferredoxin:NAD+ oxidoreductase RnfC subunit
MSVSEALEKSGVTGCGGAGFPTYAKYAKNAKLGSGVEYFIVNGAECEPLLQTDRYVMRHYAPSVVSAIAEISAELGGRECAVALKAEYKDETKALSDAIYRAGARISLHLMESFYPAGDEQSVVYEFTGRTVPPGGIPLDVGCVVSNVTTMLAAHDAMEGRPFIRKFLTVNGEVRSPLIVEVPLGTPLTECLAAAGGASIDDYCVLIGGPMMGKIWSREEFLSAGVTKMMSGIVLLPASHRLAGIQRMTDRQLAARARAACIRCSLCSELCPRHMLGHPLEPHKIMRRLALCGSIDDLPLDDAVVKTAALCCECGVCELVACPMELQPRRINAALRKRLAASGTRYPKGSGQKKAHPMREMRKIPAERAAARAGVYKYKRVHIDRLAEISPKTVILPLSQHIGAPCTPLFADGDRVETGQLIASPPAGKLGSNLHASIDGTLKILPDAIVISSEGSHTAW